MGSGFLLALGLAVRIWKSGDKKSKMGDRSSKFGVNKYVIVILPLLAASLMARALMHSYSRGAWLAAFCGLVYLVFQTKKDLNCLQNHILRWVRTHGTSAIIIVCAITVFIFWQCQQQQHLIAKRAASIVNMNDFSWRNRVFAWKGALQIIAEHPWFGTGWGQAKLMYEHYYLPSKLNEAAAIAMNDYLMLGATLGIPALFCLGMYLWLSLTQKARIGNGESLSKEADWHQTACRASAIVLLIGFWFDGGLFILPTAAIFWIVMGLGSTKLSAVEDTVSQSG
jgi:O-antigen ligase